MVLGARLHNTSGTRAKVGLAMLNAPWNIIHAATDGLQNDAPLGIEKYDEKVKQIKALGEWEMETFSRGVYVKPGIYAFADDFRCEENDDKNSLEKFVADHMFKGKSRGVSLRSILGEDGPTIRNATFKRSGSIIWMSWHMIVTKHGPSDCNSPT